MAEIYGSTTTTPIKVDKTYNPNSENAQSGKAVSEAIQGFYDAFISLDIGNAQTHAESYTDAEIIKAKQYTDKQISKVIGDAMQIAGEAEGNANGYTDGKFDKAKDYTDEKVGDIETALDSIIAIQNSLIGGGA